MRSVIIIEEENLLRDLLVLAISRLPNLNLLAEASNSLEGYDLCLKHKPDLVIIDLLSPGLHGSELISRIKKKRSKQNVLICTSDNCISALKKLIRTGTMQERYVYNDLDEIFYTNIVINLNDKEFSFVYEDSVIDIDCEIIKYNTKTIHTLELLEKR